MFKLEDGSQIIVQLDENGALRMFLEKDGKRQELSKAKEPATGVRPRTPTPTPLPTPGDPETTTRPRSRTVPATPYTPSTNPPVVPTTPYPGAVYPPTTTPRPAGSPREVALLETNLDLAKVEVAEKQILLEQAQDAAKKGVISGTEVKLKELELRKAEIKLKQAQLQLDEAKPATPPAGR